MVRALQIWRVDAAICSGIDDEAVWEGCIEVEAVNEEEAETLVGKQVMERPEWDDRIQPYFRSDGCEYVATPDEEEQG